MNTAINTARNIILTAAGKIRSMIVTAVRPKEGYFLFSENPKRSLQPLSRKFGFDRGTPIDRYYIEEFLGRERHRIRGKVLEIYDSTYTKRFGGEAVTQADALDIDTGNRLATVYGDLRHVEAVLDDTYDTLIVTHTYGVIDDYEQAIRESIRILKPGGTLLVTVSAMGIAWDTEQSFWRFTPAAMRYVFGKYLRPNGTLTVGSYGNVLSGQAFWVGCAAQELSRKELEHVDPHFPIIVTVVFTK